MVAKESDGANYASAGILASILESFKSNVDERLKSPFAGAFLVSWVLINWKALLLLLLSSRAIEYRLEYVEAAYFDSWSLLWFPLISSLVGLLSFYLLSSLYLIMYEGYGVLRRLIEKWFDRVRWTPPADYLKFKSGYLAQIYELRQLATDKLDQIVEASERANAAELLSSQLQAQEKAKSDELNSVRAQLDASNSESRDRSELAKREATKLREDIRLARSNELALEALLKEAADQLTVSASSHGTGLAGLAGLMEPPGGTSSGFRLTRQDNSENRRVELSTLLTRIEKQLKK